MTFDELKELKKQFTKDVNNFSKVAVNFFKKNRKEFDKKSLDDIAHNEFYNEIKKYNNTENETLEKAYFNLFSYTRFSFPSRYKEESLNEMNKNLEIIKDTKIYPYIKELVDTLLPKAIELLDKDKEYERLTVYFGRRNELERALQAFKTEENRKVFDKFIHSLEKWEEAKIDYTDKTLIIIGCFNSTQWWNSDLIIIDIAENIPDEVKAYFNK